MNTGDRLLYALSARSNVGWASFKRAFDSLHAVEISANDGLRYRRSEAIRVLEGLAHIELDRRSPQSRIVVTPSSLVLLPGGGLPTALLSGSRSPSGVERIGAAAEKAGIGVAFCVGHGRDSASPCRIVFTGESLNQLSEFAGSERLSFTTVAPALRLADASGSLSDYVASLPSEEIGDLKWAREDFNPSVRAFSTRRQEGASRLSRYTNRVTGIRVCFFHEGTIAIRIDPDWGRYLVVAKAGLQVIVYDPVSSLLATPVTMPLPRLLARSLSLCSGWAPSIVDGFPFGESLMQTARLYRRIPRYIAERVALKLDQQLFIQDLAEWVAHE
jgi:hypothetical protein